jgi:hypothetical protein
LYRNKYRPFGSIGRFNDHISEAINNTKRKQCTYLNNAIRKYGKEKFTLKIVESCDISILDDREQYYINEYNTLYPNGYNLTKGGKTNIIENNIVNNQEYENFKKRGREFGYKHKTSTIEKMKARSNNDILLNEKKKTMASTMSTFYDNKKIDILSKYNIDEDVTKYIKPIRNKISKEIHDYIIKINEHTLTIRSKSNTLDNKYEKLCNILNKAKEKQKINKDNLKINNI